MSNDGCTCYSNITQAIRCPVKGHPEPWRCRNQECVDLRAQLDAVTRDLRQCHEARQALQEGKPLGPVVGAHIILNQQQRVDELETQLARYRAALAGDQVFACADNLQKRLPGLQIITNDYQVSVQEFILSLFHDRKRAAEGG